jgi:hypothetical protein
VFTLTAERRCDSCETMKRCRHTGARWVCAECWPHVAKVYDGTVRNADTYTMGPGDAA